MELFLTTTHLILLCGTLSVEKNVYYYYAYWWINSIDIYLWRPTSWVWLFIYVFGSKRFTLSSILNDLLYFVRVKSFQVTAWELVSNRRLCWLSKEVDLNLNLVITCLVDLRQLLFVAFLFFAYWGTRIPTCHLVLKSWLFIGYIKIEKQKKKIHVMGN